MLLLALYKYVKENTTKAGVSDKNTAESKLVCNPIAYIMPYVNPASNEAANVLLIILLLCPGYGCGSGCPRVDQPVHEARHPR